MNAPKPKAEIVYTAVFPDHANNDFYIQAWFSSNDAALATRKIAESEYACDWVPHDSFSIALMRHDDPFTLGVVLERLQMLKEGLFLPPTAQAALIRGLPGGFKHFKLGYWTEDQSLLVFPLYDEHEVLEYLKWRNT